MSFNNPIDQRIYYPIHAIGFAGLGVEPTGASVVGGSGAFYPAKGATTLGINTTYNLEAVFQLGQLDLYDHPENIPNVEVTVTKNLDGKALIEHLGTQNATISTLAGRYNSNQCSAVVAFYNITQSASSGAPLAYVFMSGLFVNTIGFNIPVQGIMTETVGFIGNNKTWNFAPTGYDIWVTGTRFTGTEYATGNIGSGVQRRQNVHMGSCLWPTDIPGISGDNTNPVNGSTFAAHIQSVSVNVNLGRTELLELGKRGPYFRYANFPVQVTSSIEITANENGDNTTASSTANANLTDQPIKIVLDAGITIDLGTKNKLSSVSLAGGDTGGGNKTVTYSYENYNILTVLSSGDPAGLTS